MNENKTLIELEKELEIIIKELKKLEFINACWQSGSKAFQRNDDYSDIDLLFDVKDEKVNETFIIFEKLLEEKVGIRDFYKIPEPTWHGHQQKIYKLTDYNDFNFIDLVIIKNSAKNKYLEKEIHGEKTIFFDKKDILVDNYFDLEKFKAEIIEGIKDKKKFVDFFHLLIEKELKRNRYLDALAFYNRILLTPLIELVRFRTNIFHYNFGFRYLSKELEEKDLKKIENLSSIIDIGDLHNKYQEALKWYYKEYECILLEI